MHSYPGSCVAKSKDKKYALGGLAIEKEDCSGDGIHCENKSGIEGIN